ncbi:MAG: Purine nucleoside phosphorylase 1 [Elusimicrobia bacterium ADurb.Bin231]|nr:MAG: Purine nucleoside phosphorylase 1 [Elusimicrobia bacterium ADurb.Bin231]
MELLKKLDESKKFICSKTELLPEVGVILGSGLSSVANKVESAVRIPFQTVPNFSKSTVEGHSGEIVIGSMFAKPVFIMAGRIHFYEGHSLKDVTYPIRLMKHLGIKTVIITAAVGAVNKEYQPGDLMLITDHINLMGNNPLIGHEGVLQGTRFPDMSEVYTPVIIEKAEKVALSMGITLKKGVYLATTGPSYETPAEIRMMRTLGADVVGMSTVPEAIVASNCGMKVLGIAYISNMASGILKQPLSHKEVIETGKKVEIKLSELLIKIIKEI